MALADLLKSAEPGNYRKGPAGAPGEGEQLPQGEATGLNAQPPTPDPMAAAQAAFGQQIQEQIPNIGFQQSPTQFTPAKGSVEEFLFAPDTNNMQNVTAGASQYQRMPVPRGVYKLLPVLDAAAADPSAPPQLKVLRDLIVFHLGQPT